MPLPQRAPHLHGLAEQVRELACHGGVGDRHPELDGPADGVGKQAGGSLQSGPRGVQCEA